MSLKEEVGKYTMIHLGSLSRLKMLKVVDPVGGSGGAEAV